MTKRGNYWEVKYSYFSFNIEVFSSESLQIPIHMSSIDIHYFVAIMLREIKNRSISGYPNDTFVLKRSLFSCILPKVESSGKRMLTNRSHNHTPVISNLDPIYFTELGRQCKSSKQQIWKYQFHEKSQADTIKSIRELIVGIPNGHPPQLIS